jgi:hypothetical protein
MCGTPKRLTEFGARTFPSVITTIMDQKVQLLKPLNVSCIPRSRTANTRGLLISASCCKSILGVCPLEGRKKTLFLIVQ